jgi:hypothetical protein
MSPAARFTAIPLSTLALTLRARVPADKPKPSTKPDQEDRQGDNG